MTDLKDLTGLVAQVQGLMNGYLKLRDEKVQLEAELSTRREDIRRLEKLGGLAERRDRQAEGQVARGVTTAARATPPLVFAFTIIPFGAAIGYVSIAAPFWLDAQGVSLAAIGTISGIANAPHAFKFLWAPLVDLGGHRKRWFFATTVLTAVALAVLAVLPRPGPPPGDLHGARGHRPGGRDHLGRGRRRVDGADHA